ncbi:MAG: radical SAM protein [Candidatus Lokiarchaeota archaeon]|nr:radical SAM protein [Candidatus Lokiarchaeota archaeon]
MKILYVNPSRIASGLDAFIKGPPLSLISIAAMVPEHDARLFDFKVEKFHENRFRNILRRTDVVAITSMTPQIHSAIDVARMAKEEGCKTIMGGYHPTLAPDYVIKNPDVDFVIRNEGEQTFKELINFLDTSQNNQKLKTIDGISYKNSNNNIIHNKDRFLEKDLDKYPLPLRELLKSKKYTNWGLVWDLIETSRGCPHNCTFCCITKMWDDPSQVRRYRAKSTKRIMQEVYSVSSKNKLIFFCDDNFTINVKRTKKILETLIRSGMPNKRGFFCQSRVDTLYHNQDLIPLMAKAGFRQVFLGIESIHQQSLDAMNKKNTTPDMVRFVVQKLHDHGISIFAGIVLGFPGETKRMVRQTIQYAKELKPTIAQFTPITAFPGTNFYNEMRNEGKITSNNFKNYDLFHPMMMTDQLSTMDLYKLVLEAYAAYFLDGDWLKTQAKNFLNPFSKFNWGPSLIQMIKTVKDAYGMFQTQGIARKHISDELKQITREFKTKTKNESSNTIIMETSKQIELDLNALIPVQKEAIVKD